MSGCILDYASFPNTRERPRRPTASSRTRSILAVLVTIGPVDPTISEPVFADENSQTVNGNTVLAAANQDRTYLTLRNVDPSNSIVYGYADLSNLDTEGEILNAGDSVDIESLQTIYVRGIGLAACDCRIDEGIA